MLARDHHFTKANSEVHMPKAGREYEQAVYTFAQTLDPSAEVLFDHYVPDRDTGTPRQCDVWINAKFGGHWPLSILVSCKDHSRKLDIGDMEKFAGEVRSTGASTGVIYSRAGFSQPALDKAKANGLSCCRIYRNEPADLPSSLFLLDQFQCTLNWQLNLIANLEALGLVIWNDLLDMDSGRKDKHHTLLDVIASAFFDKQKKSLHLAQAARRLPSDWKTDLQFQFDQSEEVVRVEVLGIWRRYRASLEAVLLHGSYCISGNSYVGEQVGPSVDTWSKHPGAGWLEITEEDFQFLGNQIVSSLCWSDVNDLKAELKEGLGPQRIAPSANDKVANSKS